MNEMKSLTLNGKTYDSFPDKNAVKAINGKTPDQNGNVEIEIPEGGGSVVAVEPMDDDIPKVYFTGALPTSKADGDVRLTMHYISKTADFVYPVTLKVQGGSSVDYAKKNFTLKPYKGSSYESKKKLKFKGWPELNKFVLKAHWIDHSHVRNVGTAKIWGKVVASRPDYDSLPEELRNAPNNGATDGFTCKVFCNGVYHGLYEWIVPKDKLFGQDSDIATHSILNSEWNNQPTCAFATTTPTISGNWSEELQDSMSSDISTSFANLIKFVAGSTDAEFIANAETYFDVQSVIDFNIFARVFCIVDNLCRNQIFFTYDGVKWYEGCWDVDAVLGLHPTNGTFLAYDTEFQTGYLAYKNYGMTNLLYQRVETLFADRFKERYAELRSGVLSVENILDVYERLTDVITTYDGLLAEDYASTTAGGAFTGIPAKTTNNIQQIRNFAAQRIPYMDAVIADMADPVPCTGVSLNANKLTFTADGTQTLTATVTPDGCTDAMVWVSTNPEIATITVDGNVCTVKAVANGNSTIIVTCGKHSASCPVEVSGLYEPVACTGITLDKTELTFTEEGSQTIVATVTPADTTDVISWSSDNESVATVENGVVTALANGSANITATCGNYSASCSVTVSGIAVNVLKGVETHSGWIGASGVITDGSETDFYTDAFGVANYAGSKFMMIADNGGNINSSGSRVVFYNSSNAFLSTGNTVNNSIGTKSFLKGTIPGSVDHARISLAAKGTDIHSIVFGTYDANLVGTGDKLADGQYYSQTNGAIATDSSLSATKIPVSAGEVYFNDNIRSRVYFDANMQFISSDASAEWGPYAVPDGAVYMGVNYYISNATAGKVVLSKLEQIGHVEYTE